MRHALALAALFVVGCGGRKPASTSSQPATSTGSATAGTDRSRAACAAAIAEAAKTGKQGDVFSPEDQQFSAEIEVVMTDSCAATRWPEAILLCLTHGSTREELNSCTELLTPAQRQDMMERVLVITKKHEAATQPAARPVPGR